ncbi:MAG: hypothetical protein J7494_06410 [Sphingobium sp.]|nr:hypothetical protein [Sphingobium sp.]
MFDTLWQALEGSRTATAIASGEYAFPLIETFHVFAIVTVFGTIAIMDLRLLGLTSMGWSISSVSRDTLKLTWGAFLIAVVTGCLMFVSKATTYMINPYFLWKMALIALAGVNMAVLHLTTWKTIGSWDKGTAIPAAAKVSGALSLAFWIIVIFCGRFIGFTLGVYQPPL